jgi:predicted DNA binding protein
MRRMVIEIPQEEFAKYDKGSVISLIKTYEMLNLLRYDHQGFAAVIKIQFNDTKTPIEVLFNGETSKDVSVQLLDSTKEGEKTYFITGKTLLTAEKHALLSSGSFFSNPVEIRNGKITMTFLGEPENIKNLLELGDQMGVHFKIISSSDAKLAQDSPLNGLTQKQREVLVLAYENGFYASPRKISSRQLASKLHIKCSTLVEHRRKAEERLISEVLK